MLHQCSKERCNLSKEDKIMSNTIINTNVSALNSHRAILGVSNRQSRSAERLSSGMRINRAADDAAGLAISEKMRNQIRGLDQAVRNSQDGISLIQTAEGAMEEIHRILERVRELTNQAANDTNTQEDRRQIHAEVAQILGQITHIAERTEFNTQAILNGGEEALDVTPTPPPGGDGGNGGTGPVIVQVPGVGFALTAFDDAGFTGNTFDPGPLIGGLEFFDGASQTAIEDAFNDALYELVNGAPPSVPGTAPSGTDIDAWLADAATHGYDLYALGLDSFQELFEFDEATSTLTVTETAAAVSAQTALMTALNSVDLQAPGKVISSPVGTAANIVPFNTPPNAEIVDVSWTGDVPTLTFIVGSVQLDDGVNPSDVETAIQNALNALFVQGTSGNATDWLADYSGMSYAAAPGTIEDLMGYYETYALASAGTFSGNEAQFDEINAARNLILAAIDGADLTPYIYVPTAELPPNGPGEPSEPGENDPVATYLHLQLQTGANSDQRMDVSVRSMSLASLGLAGFADRFHDLSASGEDADYSFTEAGVEFSNKLDQLDVSINIVSTQRANLGAIQNRLDHTINNLRVSSENLSAANSRIRDTDMAAEMMRFTQANVLQQAGLSMLAQANQAPQSVLQLL